MKPRSTASVSTLEHVVRGGDGAQRARRVHVAHAHVLGAQPLPHQTRLQLAHARQRCVTRVRLRAAHSVHAHTQLVLMHMCKHYLVIGTYVMH